MSDEQNENENLEINDNEENEEGNEIDDDGEQKNNNSNDENRANKENIGKAELIADYKEKEKIYNLIIKNNEELKNKINLTNEKYNEILKRIEEKLSTDVEQQLKNKINSMEKEIEAYQTENKNYKKKIEQLKNSVYFKNSVANSSALKSVLKQEKIKNKEYTEELKTLQRIQKFNKQLILRNEEEYKIKENLKNIEEQIKEIKEQMKKMNEDYNLLERYFKLIHEKIVGLDFVKIKKKKEIIEIKKEEEKKSFTNQEIKDILQLIITLRHQIFEKRAKLNNINTNGEDRMHKFFSQNKSIEIEWKEELKIYKELTSKKNQLKKLINKLNSKQNKQKTFKKQDSIKENTSNNIDLENLNNFNSQILNNTNENVESNEINKINNNNIENIEIINNSNNNDKNVNEINEERFLDNINENKKEIEKKEIKEPVEKL